MDRLIESYRVADDGDDDDPPFSTNDRLVSANDTFGKGFFADGALAQTMEMPARSAIGRHLPDLKVAVRSIIGVWLLYMALVSLRSLVLQYPDFWGALARRSVVATVGMALTFVVYVALRPLDQASLGKKATIAGLLCFPASFAYAAFNYTVFHVYAPLDDDKMRYGPMKDMSPIEMAYTTILESALSWYFLFAAWAAFYVAMSYARQLRAADGRAAAFAREAQEAQLRALRYQINPHFLFNTLNSLSSLILSQRTDVAERMIMNLSNFFRTTLSADPTADISLDEEIALQRLYLDIEQVRFPERLKFEIDVPDPVRSVRVPVLILQPIVENAIKYGVARSRRPVTVRIAAREAAGKLHLTVHDDGEPIAAGADGGTGVGLKNVCERLVARYGVEAGCFYGADPDGGFSVHVVIPAVRSD